MRRSTVCGVFGVLIGIVVTLTAAGAAAAAGTVKPARQLVPQRQQQMQVAAQAMQGIEFPTTVRTLVGKAQPDECYDGGPVGTPPCTAPAVPKVNQGYAWSMVEAGGKIWFGTVANPLCGVLGGYLGVSDDIQTNSFACELAGGPFGDLRSPEIWLHTPPGNTVEKTPTLPPASLLVLSTLGMRAAGAHDGSNGHDAIVLIGGPRLTLGGIDGLNLFAFDPATGNLLAAGTIGAAPAVPAGDYTVYTDIRAFLLVEGELYAGVKYELRDGGDGSVLERGGKVLRWTGDTDPGDELDFVEAGTIETEAAYLAYHEGRLLVSTWPVVDPNAVDPFPANVRLAAVWMSPEFGDGILDDGDGAWTKIWDAGDYEPDPLVAATYGGGAIASFDGYLFWGTMHVPFVATLAHLQLYSDYYDGLSDVTSPTLQQAVLSAMVGTQRTGKVFRGADLTTAPDIDLLYGLPVVPTFTFNPGDPPTGSWSAPPNTMGLIPEFGLPGFGNVLNNYIWAMQTHGDRLWVGTMDWSYLIYDLAWAALEELLGEDFEIPPGALPPLLEEYFNCLLEAEETATIFGGDLYYFPGGDRPAFPESIGGVGNYSNYGIRSMASATSGLYLGTANPMNLLTDTSDDLPEGGWEVLRLVDRPENTPAGENVVATLADGSTVTFCGVMESGHTVGTWVPTPCCGLWMPVPLNYQPPQQMMLLGSSALLAENNGCSSIWPLRVCVPSPGPGLTRIYQPVLTGTTMDWLDITSGFDGDLVCGDLQEGSQPLLQDLGYQGYLGIVVALQQNDAIPALAGWGLAGLACLLAAAGAIVLRGRIG